MQRIHLRTQLAAGLEPGTFVFWAQLAKHKATFWFIGNWMQGMNSQL